MNRRKVAVGPGASSLILISVVLCLSVLAVLTMVSARNDDALSVRSGDTVQQVYQLNASSEAAVAELDGLLARSWAEAAGNPEEYLSLVQENLPDRMSMREDSITWEEDCGERTMLCGIRLTGEGELNRYVWTIHSLVTEGGSEVDFDE